MPTKYGDFGFAQARLTATLKTAQQISGVGYLVPNAQTPETDYDVNLLERLAKGS